MKYVSWHGPWRRAIRGNRNDEPPAGAERSSALQRAILALVMPVPKRHFAPGDPQFLTSSTYRRARLFEGDRLRLISGLSVGRRVALCASLSPLIHGKPGQVQRRVPQTRRGGSAKYGGCLTLRYNLPLRPQHHCYGLDHSHYLTTTTYCRAPAFNSEPFKRKFVTTLADLCAELRSRVKRFLQ